MHTTKRISVVLALLLLLQTFTACEKATEETADDTKDAVSITDTETETQSAHGVPAQTTFDDTTLTIWYTTTPGSELEPMVDLAGDPEGDSVNDAIYQRNLRVQDELEVVLDYQNNIDKSSRDTGSVLEQMVLAGDSTYDLFALVQWNGTAYAYKNMLYNMKEAPYISWDKPWWNYDFMKEMTIGEDKIYCLVGDVVLDTTRCLSCVYYNKNMYQDFYGDGDGLYTTVLDGDWTLDLVMKIAEEVYQDTNENNQIDYDDRLGYAVNYNNLDSFLFGGGQHITTRDENDLPVLALMTETNEDIIQKLLVFTNDCAGGWCYGYDANGPTDTLTSFTSGNMMFLFGFLYTAEIMRDMEDDYGILPPPKALDSMSSYGIVNHDIMEMMAVPTSIATEKIPATSATLEALAYYGYQDILPVYYEQTLKTKYARDEASSQMIDLIRDNLSTDIAYIYMDAFNSLGYAARYTVIDNSSLSVFYAKNVTAAENNMQTLIDQFTSIG